MTGLVSAVVPVFQQEAYVEEAVRSLLDQTWTDLEIICVDDGSRDRSSDILRAIGDPRLKIITQDNRGPSEALNSGIAAARGELVFVMGGDDVSEPERFAHQIEQIETTGVDFLFCLPKLIDTAGAPLADTACLPLFDGPSRMSSAARYRRFFDSGNHLCAPTMCAKRSSLARVGRFHAGLVQLQDWHYWVRALAAGCRIDVSDERLVRYRRHDSSLSHSDQDHVLKREAHFVLREFFNGAPAALVREAFSGIIDPAGVAAPLRPGESALCYLAHKDENVRTFGFLQLIEARENHTSQVDMSWLDYQSFRNALSIR